MLLTAGDQKAAAKDLRLARIKVYFFMIWSKENIDLLSTTKIMLDLEIGMSETIAIYCAGACSHGCVLV